MKKISLWILSLLFVSLLWGCDQRSETTPESSLQTPETEANSPSSDQEFLQTMLKKADEVQVDEKSITFQDDSGRESVTLTKLPKKVAVLYGSHACLWTQAGGTASLIMGGKSAIELYQDQLGRDITQDPGVKVVAETPSAKNWDIEKILAEKPDLIITANIMQGYSTISKPAEAASIPVIALSYYGVEDFLKWFKIFSHLNGKPELFEQQALPIAKTINAIVAKVPKENNPRVLSLAPGSKGLQASLKNSNMGRILQALKGVNLAEEVASKSEADLLPIDLEQIYALNPEMIFIRVSKSQEETENQLNKLVADNPVWANLEAVKNNRVYFMPKHLFHQRANLKFDEAYRMMAKLLYPDINFD